MQDEIERLRAANWNSSIDGALPSLSLSSSSLSLSPSIPILVTLAPTSLSSTTVPPPVHVLVSRQTYLHVGLEDAVRRLHQYAPTTFSFGGSGQKKVVVVEESDVGGDSNSGVGTTNPPNTATPTTTDNKDGTDGVDDRNTSTNLGPNDNDGDDDNNNNNNNNGSTEEPIEGDSSGQSAASNNKKEPQKDDPYPICWFEDEATKQPLRWQYFVGVLFDSIRPLPPSPASSSSSSSYLPWRIRLHFQSYPSQQLLEIDPPTGVLTTVERTFKNSLKQALVLQHGNSKVALNMTKQTHQAIWSVIRAPNYAAYRPIIDDIQVRDDSQLVMIPIRMSIDPTKPMIQRRCGYIVGSGNNNNNNNNNEAGDDRELGGNRIINVDINSSTIHMLTLGSLLCDWAPQYFEPVTTTTGTTLLSDAPNEGEHGSSSSSSPSSTSTLRVQPRFPETTSWRVAGIVPPLSTPVVALWRGLCHPDQFLYISVVVSDSGGGGGDLTNKK